LDGIGLGVLLESIGRRCHVLPPANAPLALLSLLTLKCSVNNGCSHSNTTKARANTILKVLLLKCVELPLCSRGSPEWIRVVINMKEIFWILRESPPDWVMVEKFPLSHLVDSLSRVFEHVELLEADMDVKGQRDDNLRTHLHDEVEEALKSLTVETCSHVYGHLYARLVKTEDKMAIECVDQRLMYSNINDLLPTTKRRVASLQSHGIKIHTITHLEWPRAEENDMEMEQSLIRRRQDLIRNMLIRARGNYLHTKRRSWG